MKKEMKYMTLGVLFMLAGTITTSVTVMAAPTVHPAKKALATVEMNGKVTTAARINQPSNEIKRSILKDSTREKQLERKVRERRTKAEVDKTNAEILKRVMKGPKAKEIQKLLAHAKKYTGVPYVFGGSTPSGFDCSGYLSYVFKEATGIQIPRSADAQYAMGKAISVKDLEPGDLVFFETYEPGASHSGIYMGNGAFISATTSAGVAVADMTQGYWHDRFLGAKRVF